jgi:hypothetical protein
MRKLKLIFEFCNGRYFDREVIAALRERVLRKGDQKSGACSGSDHVGRLCGVSSRGAVTSPVMVKLNEKSQYISKTKPVRNFVFAA